MGTKTEIVIDGTMSAGNLRERGLALAQNLTLRGSAVTSVASVFSELARFILDHSFAGVILIERLEKAERHAVRFTVTVKPLPARTGKKGSSPSPAAECRLPPGIVRFKSHMDEFEILSESKMTMTKWFTAKTGG
jgi:hypothetical protein